jgi:hypothetical protein
MNGDDFILTLIVDYSNQYNPASTAWKYELYKNTELLKEVKGTGMKDLLNILKGNFKVPEQGTKEYDSLCEWLDSKGKTVHVNNSPAPSKSSNTPVGKIPDQTYRYTRLLAQIDADGFCKYTVNVLDFRTLDITLKNGVEVKLERNDHFPIYTLTVEDTSQSFDDYEDVLDALIEEGIIGDTDLCEWLDTKGNKINFPKASASSPKVNTTSSKTNKEKFEELTNYMLTHKSTLSVIKSEVIRLDDGGFTFKDYRKSPTGEYVLTLLVGYSRFSPQWKYEIYMDTALVEEQSGNGFKELLNNLHNFFNVPNAGTPEYKSICESASFAEDFRLYESLWD